MLKIVDIWHENDLSFKINDDVLKLITNNKTIDELTNDYNFDGMDSAVFSVIHDLITNGCKRITNCEFGAYVCIKMGKFPEVAWLEAEVIWTKIAVKVENGNLSSEEEKVKAFNNYLSSHERNKLLKIYTAYFTVYMHLRDDYTDENEKELAFSNFHRNIQDCILNLINKNVLVRTN